MSYDGSRKHVREACEASLKRLEIDTIDLYYLHRCAAAAAAVGAQSLLNHHERLLSALLLLPLLGHKACYLLLPPLLLQKRLGTDTVDLYYLHRCGPAAAAATATALPLLLGHQDWRRHR
jgi:aryl-alcohol dehydrogenase-like predicted oxidoreductase